MKGNKIPSIFIYLYKLYMPQFGGKNAMKTSSDSKKSSMKGGLEGVRRPTCDRSNYDWQQLLENHEINNDTITKILLKNTSYNILSDKKLVDKQREAVSNAFRNFYRTKNDLQTNCKKYREKQEGRVKELKDKNNKIYGFTINENNSDNSINNILLNKQKQNIKDDIINKKHTHLIKSMKEEIYRQEIKEKYEKKISEQEQGFLRNLRNTLKNFKIMKSKQN